MKPLVLTMGFDARTERGVKFLSDDLSQPVASIEVCESAFVGKPPEAIIITIEAA